MASAPERLVETTATGDVGTTVRRLAEAAQARGMTVFATIDHAAAAREAGLELADEVVVVLGAPQVGTRLMQASARTGLDLPLRVLVWDDGGTTRLAHHDPAGLGAAHRLDGLDEVLARMGAGLEAVVADAAAA